MKKKILLIYDRDLMPFTFFRQKEVKYYKIEAKNGKMRSLRRDESSIRRVEKQHKTESLKKRVLQRTIWIRISDSKQENICKTESLVFSPESEGINKINRK